MPKKVIKIGITGNRLDTRFVLRRLRFVLWHRPRHMGPWKTEDRGHRLTIQSRDQIVYQETLTNYDVERLTRGFTDYLVRNLPEETSSKFVNSGRAKVYKAKFTGRVKPLDGHVRFPRTKRFPRLDLRKQDLELSHDL